MSQTFSRAQPQYAKWISLTVILALATALRLYRLDFQAPWADEVGRIVWARGYLDANFFGLMPSESGIKLPLNSFWEAVKVIIKFDPPVNGILLHLWMKLTDWETDLALRLPFAIFGILTVALMFHLGQALHSPKVGVFAAFLMAISPFHIYYSQEINHYSSALFFVALSYTFFLRFLTQPSISTASLLIVTNCISFYTHYFVGAVVAAQALSAAYYFGYSCKKLLSLFGLYSFLAVTLVPLIIILKHQMAVFLSSSVSFGGIQLLLNNLATMPLRPLLGMRVDWPLPYAEAFLLAISTLWIFGIYRLRGSSMFGLVVINSLVPYLLVSSLYLIQRENTFLWPRYQSLFLVGFYIPLAVALAATRILTVTGITLALALSWIGNNYQYHELVKESWREVARIIDTKSKSEETTVLAGPRLLYSLARYLTTNRIFGIIDGDSLAKQIDVITQSYRGVWFISAWPVTIPYVSTIESILAEKYSVKEEIAINPGIYKMRLLHYYDAKKPTPSLRVNGAAWNKSTSGEVIEAASFAMDHNALVCQDNFLVIPGWAFSTLGTHKLIFSVNGKEIGRADHPGMPRLDVAAAFPAAPQSHSSKSGFLHIQRCDSLPRGGLYLSLQIEREDRTISPPLVRLRIRNKMATLNMHTSDDACLDVAISHYNDSSTHR